MISIKAEMVVIFKEEEGDWLKKEHLERVWGAGNTLFFDQGGTFTHCTLFLTRAVFTVKVSL